MNGGRVVLFDGTCRFCNGAVRFILARERDHDLRFAPLDSAAGRTMLAAHGLDPDDHTTLVFVGVHAALVRSDAWLAIATHLRAPWRWMAALRILPRRLRDAAYHVVARNRYRWFGTLDRCEVLTPETAARFLA